MAEAGKHFRQTAEEDMKAIRVDRDRRLEELQVSIGAVESDQAIRSAQSIREPPFFLRAYQPTLSS